MLIMRILQINQPDIYNSLREKYKLYAIHPAGKEPIQYVDQPDFPEDSYNFRKHKRIMQERKAVHL